MTTSFDKMLDQAWRGKPVDEVLAASPAVLLGVSAADAQKLKAAFDVDTVRELAELSYVVRAQALLAAAGTPGFDPGPSAGWESYFREAPVNHYAQHPSRRFRTEFGPVYYRGRLDGSARVLVIGQDPATNEILAQRAFVGSAGQRLQGFLKKIGLKRSYLMLNTFLFGIHGQFDAEMRNITLEPDILAYRNAGFDKVVAENPIQAIVAAGSAARHAVEHWPGKGDLPVFNIQHPSARDSKPLLESWSAALPGLVEVVDSDEDMAADPTPYPDDFRTEDIVDIPRQDLPFDVPTFLGTSAGSSRRDGDNTIEWTAP